MSKEQVISCFEKAASSYETEAPVQKLASQTLCQHIQQIIKTSPKNALEIGCGTGYLTQEIIKAFPRTDWLITDLTEPMLNHCRKNVGEGVRYDILDGENVQLKETFDLIVSSLAFQWFEDLEKTLADLAHSLNEGGKLIFATLGPNSFKEWRALLQKHHLNIGLHNYPSAKEIQSFNLENVSVNLETISVKQPYKNGRHFLNALKTIGAATPNKDYTPMSAGKLRPVLKEFDTNFTEITYEIIIVELKRLR